MNSCGTSSVGLKPFTTANPASHPNGLPGDLQEGTVIAAIQTIMPRRKLSDGIVDTSLGHMGTAQNLITTPVELPALMKAGGWHLSRIPASYTKSQAAGRGAVPRCYAGMWEEVADNADSSPSRWAKRCKTLTIGVELRGPRVAAAAAPATHSEPDLTRVTPRAQGVMPVVASDRSGDPPSAPAARRYHDAAVRPACPPASADRTQADKAPVTPAAGTIAPDRGSREEP